MNRPTRIRPIRSDRFIEFDTASGYDPNGERAEAFHFLDFKAYGFRDDDYFILKIKGAFPGELQLNPR